MTLSRRQFFTMTGVGAVGVVLTAAFKAPSGSQASPLVDNRVDSVGYGPLQSDPSGLLDLPAGFQYRILSRQGAVMNDGQLVPTAFDGMAAFADAAGNTILIRNHELAPGESTKVIAEPSKQYDSQCNGGTTTLVVSRDRQLIREYASLAGTVRNCAGGTTPWGTWISCEEDTSTPTAQPSQYRNQVSKRHGYNFEIPATATAPVTPEPLVAMGRFRHEAIAVDPRTGIVYQTEDQVDGLFYRFIPVQPGNLSAGGILEALRIANRPQAMTHTNFPVGEPMTVDWVRIDEVDPVDDTVRLEGFSKGAAQFSRGEGICYDQGVFYFTCTNGGNVPHGQVWRYSPGITADEGGMLELFVQPDDPAILDLPDNLIMAPSGDLLLCEDGDGQQYIVGLTPDGQFYKFARNGMNSSEFAGICFAPDGQTMFVNVYRPGITYAIWADNSSGA